MSPLGAWERAVGRVQASADCAEFALPFALGAAYRVLPLADAAGATNASEDRAPKSAAGTMPRRRFERDETFATVP